jgi:hypothetical protein
MIVVVVRTVQVDIKFGVIVEVKATVQDRSVVASAILPDTDSIVIDWFSSVSTYLGISYDIIPVA